MQTHVACEEPESHVRGPSREASGRASHPRGCRRRRLRLGRPRARARCRRDGGDGGPRRGRLRRRGRAAVRLAAAAAAPLRGRGAAWSGVRVWQCCTALPLWRNKKQLRQLAPHSARGYLLARAIGVAGGVARGRGDEPG